MSRKFVFLLPMIFFAGAADAADYNASTPELYLTSSLRGSIGLRYWYSRSHSELDTSDFELNSTDSVTSHTAELVGTLEDVTANTFVRGYVGLGKNVSGDADFLGYASTDIEQKTIGYVVVDGGWQFTSFANNQARLKGFIGYHYLNDGIEVNVGSTSLEQSRQWHALRLGLSAEGDLTDRVGWSVDLAGVPWSYNKVDTLNSSWRADWTYGVEADAMLNVALTENWHLGVGGRYWWLQSNFDRRWRDSGEKIVLDQNYQRYGLLLESKYQF
ncbi:MAG: hypothetical protein AAGA50_08085 [Pseudomonadota bacterium]